MPHEPITFQFSTNAAVVMFIELVLMYSHYVNIYN